MTESTRKTLVAALGIVALGLVVGLVNNLFAGSARRLDWVGEYPPKGEPACRKVLVDGVAASTAAAPSAAASDPAASDPAPPDPALAAGETATAASDPALPAGGSGTAVEPSASAPPTRAMVASGSVDIPPVPLGQPWIELSPQQAKEAHDRGALFVDARRTSVYEEGHVAGAMSIPIWESGVEEKIAQVMFASQVQGDPAATIVVYCGGGDCEDSHMVGNKLSGAGHVAVYVYKDGFPNWKDSGWPVTVGSAP